MTVNPLHVCFRYNDYNQARLQYLEHKHSPNPVDAILTLRKSIVKDKLRRLKEAKRDLDCCKKEVEELQKQPSQGSTEEQPAQLEVEGSEEEEDNESVNDEDSRDSLSSMHMTEATYQQIGDLTDELGEEDF